MTTKLKNNAKTLAVQNTFLERLLNEEKELGEKIANLNKGLYSDGFANKVGNHQFELLNLQHGAMITYRRVLNMRINNLVEVQFENT